MTFTEMALRMFPYWIVGLVFILIVYFSDYRNILRVDKKTVFKFFKFLSILTVLRIILFNVLKLDSQLQASSIIPWQGTFFVFWEDMAYIVPIFFLQKATENFSKIYKDIIYFAVLITTMISFGLGHTYQGYVASAFISLYIPFALQKGKELGFGTTMLCHVMYDLFTILTVQLYLRGL